MSPWPMMNEWGIPTFYLEALAYEFSRNLVNMGMRTPDIAMAGGSLLKMAYTKQLRWHSLCKGRMHGSCFGHPRYGGEEHR